MSLLMDALKRAETNRQAAPRGGEAKMPASPGMPSLEPLSPPASRSPAKPLPELAAHHETVDAELASSLSPPFPPSAKTSPPGTRQQAQRPTEHNAFAAKQNIAPPARQPLWLTLGVLGMAGASIAGYVAYPVMNQGSHFANPDSMPSPAPSASQPLSASSAPSPVPAIPVVLPPAGELTAGAGSERRPLPPPSPHGPRSTSHNETSPMPAEQIRLRRSHAEADPNQTRGYANLQRNELELARYDYEQALRRDPHNTDALLALAAIAQHQGRAGDAESLYQRALVANPSDPAVQGAALNGASAAIDPQNTESRLKSLLAKEPESASLNFALGNLYARQNRWAEAQPAYFNAVAADNDNPDYLFNLAVSLDHIRQAKLAVQHYRLALEAADKRPATFAREQITRRLGELLP